MKIDTQKQKRAQIEIELEQKRAQIEIELEQKRAQIEIEILELKTELKIEDFKEILKALSPELYTKIETEKMWAEAFSKFQFPAPQTFVNGGGGNNSSGLEALYSGELQTGFLEMFQERFSKRQSNNLPTNKLNMDSLKDTSTEQLLERGNHSNSKNDRSAMNFTFSVSPESPEILKSKLISKSNGLFKTLQLGYSYHIPIAIRPDDVINTIACIWSKYIVLNSEMFRKFFVNHEGKKTLKYETNIIYCHELLPMFMNGIIDLMKKDRDNDKFSWMETQTSTTTILDRLIRYSAILASQKEYYNYMFKTKCGFSSVNLLGTQQDWDKVEFAIQSMPILDDGIRSWQSRLLKTISKMRSGDELFWQKCINKNRAYGSGSEEYNGWILDFNPINEKGRWMSGME